jgi:hypothetical protein
MADRSTHTLAFLLKLFLDGMTVFKPRIKYIQLMMFIIPARERNNDPE